MRAAVYRGPHDIAIEERPIPELAHPDDVLVEVTRAAICGTDAAEWSHGPLLTRPPVVLGHEFTGRVARVGSAVTVAQVGQRVVSGAGVWCGECSWCGAGRPNLCASYETLGLHRDGGLAAFARVPAKTLRPVPDAVTDDDAALAQPLAVALHAVRRSEVRPGQSLAVVGVGGIGAFIVAAAASLGVADLTAVDIDAHRLATARRLGATVTIDARDIDLVEAIRAGHPDGPDVIIEASGAPGSPGAAIAAVRRGGRIVLVGLQSARRETDLFAVSVREIELIGTLAHICDEDLPDAIDVLARRPLADTVVERTLSLDELVPIGIARLADRTATGKYLVDPSTNQHALSATSQQDGEA